MRRVAGPSVACSETKRAVPSTSDCAAMRTPAHFVAELGSQATTSIPKSPASRATSRPIAPNPTIPRRSPWSSNPG